jgi:hypothetical protein
MEDKILDEELSKVLKGKNAEKCPRCGRVLDRGDCAWNTGQTEPGTPFSDLYIRCQKCDTEIKHISTWYFVESFEEFIEQLNEEWDQ